MLNDYSENLWLLNYFFSLAITIVVCKVLSMHIHIHTISQVASLSKHTWEKKSVQCTKLLQPNFLQEGHNRTYSLFTKHFYFINRKT